MLITDIRKNFFSILFMFILVLLTYYLFYGRNGILMTYSISSKIEKQTAVLKELQNIRETKEQNVSMLRVDNIDIDLLEEQARLLFNVKSKGEIQIIKD